MTCARVRESLPLFVEGDLTAAEASSLGAHLAGCAACREEEAAFRASQAFLKEVPTPVFDETFHADVRRAVRLRISAEAETRRRFAFVRLWATLAATAAAILVAFLLVRRPQHETTFAARPTPAPAAPEAPAVAQTPAVLAPAVPAASVAAHPHSHRPALARHAPRPATDIPRVTRIEMRTANPNVRLIWLANAGDAAPI